MSKRRSKEIKRPIPSIRSRIFLSMLILLSVMLLILWVSQTIFLSQIYQYVKMNEMEKVTKTVTENIGNENFKELLDDVSNDYEICFTVIDITDDGHQIVYSSHSMNDCIIHKLPTEKIISKWYAEASKNGGEITKIITHDEFFDTIYGTEQVPDENELSDSILSVTLSKNDSGNTYLYALNSSVHPVSATIRTIRTQLTTISIIMIAVTCIISFILSKRISSPICNMSKDVKVFSSGNYDVRFAETGTEETVELAKALNHMKDELSKVDKLQKELIANISHDLRTPLTMISGYSEVIRDIPGENTPENMQVIIDETARLSSLVNDLLNVSKLQSGHVPLNIQRINITEAVRSTVARYDKLISHEGFKILFDYDCDVYILADEIRMLQVIYNLINNAINYAGDDKKVTVKQETVDGKVKILITDTGCGISEDDLPFIWDRYYKVDKVHKRARVGTGLGLSIVKSTLTLHSCTFGVSSEIDKGSTFWFEFNIADTDNILCK